MNVRLVLSALAMFALGCASDGADAGSSGGVDGGEKGNTDGNGDTDVDSGGDSDSGEVDEALEIVAEDAFNYSFSSSLEIETVPVKSLSNIRFDWSGVTTDMLGHPFNPNTSVDMMEVMAWRYEPEDLLAAINNDAMNMGNFVAAGYINTEQSMSEGYFLDVLSPSGGDWEDDVLLAFLDTAIYDPAETTYFAMVAEGFNLGSGTKMIIFFKPSPDETNTEVVMNNESTILRYEADLTSLEPLCVPLGDSNIVLDWLDNDILLENAMGGEWIPTKINDVMIAHYANKTPAQLEEEFLNLELIADDMWSVFLSAGQSVNFSRLKDAEGNAFPGIDDTGTWIVALKCGECNNPAPWFLSILRSCLQE